MAPLTAVLIPGAGGEAWYWHCVVPLLERDDRISRVVAVELPAADDSAGWVEYVQAALASVGDEELLVIGQSMGGFTAALVAAARPTRALVLLNAMIPAPGETGGDWWTMTGQGEAAAAYARAQGRPMEFDGVVDLFHDVPADVVAQALARPEAGQSGTPFEQVWPGERWPEVPTTVLAGADDRLFPLEFQRRVARERLGLEVQVVPGGHLAALSQPEAVAYAVLGVLG